MDGMMDDLRKKRISDHQLKRDDVLKIINSDSIPMPQKKQQLQELRKKEIDRLDKDELADLISQGVKGKQIFRPKYHYCRHCKELGLKIVEKEQDVTLDMIEEMRKQILRNKMAATEIYTYFHMATGFRQWAYVKHIPDGVKVMIWDEDNMNNATLFTFKPESKFDYFLKNSNYVKVR